MRWKIKNNHRDRTWLDNQYNVKDKTVRAIAKTCGVTEGTILTWLKKFNLIWHPLKYCEICKKEVNKVFEITDHRDVHYDKVCSGCRESIKLTIKMRVQKYNGRW